MGEEREGASERRAARRNAWQRSCSAHQEERHESGFVPGARAGSRSAGWRLRREDIERLNRRPIIAFGMGGVKIEATQGTQGTQGTE